MIDDERAVRELLHRSTPTFEPLDGAAVRAAGQRPREHGSRRLVLPLAVAATVAAIAVASVLITQHTSSSAPAGPKPVPASTGNRGAADHAFRVRLVLTGTSFPANGQPIAAYVLAINHTGRPVVINDACNGWVQAGLVGGRASFDVSSLDVACASKSLGQGTTRVPVRILTTFTGCLQGDQPGTGLFPRCLAKHGSPLPNLPAGKYQAVVGTQDVSVQPVLSKPQTVTLTAPPK